VQPNVMPPVVDKSASREGLIIDAVRQLERFAERISIV